MTKEEKIRSIKEDKELIENIKNEFKELNISFYVEGEPKPYARERFTKFGGKGHGRFYNKRASFMEDLKNNFKSQVSEKDKKLIESIIKHNEEFPYYVELSGQFYIKIPTSDSIKTRALKQAGVIRPIVSRGDVDNYIKLVLDVLHGVIYEDDKHVVTICSEKYYSETPRLELQIKIIYNGGIENEIF